MSAAPWDSFWKSAELGAFHRSCDRTAIEGQWKPGFFTVEQATDELRIYRVWIVMQEYLKDYPWKTD